MLSPFEGFSHGGVVVINEGQHLGAQIGDRDKGALFEQLANENAKPDFDLIHPGGMLRRVVEDNSMRRIGKELRTGFHGFENARLAFLAQIDSQIGLGGNKVNQRLRAMCVQVVNHNMPTSDFGMSRHHPGDMRQIILFCPGRSRRNENDAAPGNVEGDDKG